MHINQKLLNYLSHSVQTKGAAWLFFWGFFAISEMITLHQSYFMIHFKDFGTFVIIFRVWFLLNCNKGPEPAQPQ